MINLKIYRFLCVVYYLVIKLYEIYKDFLIRVCFFNVYFWFFF